MKKLFRQLLSMFVLIFIISNVFNLFRVQTPNLNTIKKLNFQNGIIYFWATWCPVCKLQKSQINSVSKSIKVLKINNQDLANSFQIKAYPTIFYVKNGKIIYSDIGYTSSFSIRLKYFLIKTFSKNSY